MEIDDIHEKWVQTCRAMKISDGKSHTTWKELVSRYSEPHRRYHTLDHLWAMCRTLSEFEEKLAAPDAVYLAVFFHDAIYDSSSTTNEQDSAELATSFLTENNVASSVIRAVEQLILATAEHLQETTALDAEWFLDADLAILAAERDSYHQYVLAIRQEYSDFSDATFCAGRLRFLEMILNAPHLYRTIVLRERFEASARANLQNEFAHLQSGQD
jgi:predicted metal-dependent HD superfamily phosphohydrolase